MTVWKTNRASYQHRAECPVTFHRPTRVNGVTDYMTIISSKKIHRSSSILFLTLHLLRKVRWSCLPFSATYHKIVCIISFQHNSWLSVLKITVGLLSCFVLTKTHGLNGLVEKRLKSYNLAITSSAYLPSILQPLFSIHHLLRKLITHTCNVPRP